MRRWNLSHYAMSSCAALLAGCGGTQLPIGAPGANTAANEVAHRLPATSSYEVLHRFSLRGHAASSAPVGGLLNVNGTLYGTTSGKATGKHECGTVFSLSTAGAEKTLHRFQGPGDGCGPLDALVDLNGTLYGTTYTGGQYGHGVVFSITTSGAETVLYTFKGPPDGANPWGGLVAVNGTLFGTTAGGGNVGGVHCPDTVGGYGCGTIYSITTGGAESVLYAFKGEPDGYRPLAPLIAVKGKLYGTTTSGGLYSGTVFSVTTTGSEKVLYAFTGGTDGNYPFASLLNVNGTLYGTTTSGGSSNNGNVFSVTPSGSENVLYSFAGGSDGQSPAAPLINVNGTFYGTTNSGGGSGCNSGLANGCGTIYSLTPSGSEKVLNRFQGGRDGALPQGALVNLSGTLYGTTFAGGGKGCDGRGCGTAFAIRR